LLSSAIVCTVQLDEWMMDESQEILARWRSGQESAAEEVFHRYAARLIGLVRVHLSEKYASRLDAEDVVQSAFRSFFRGSRDGRYLLQRSGDLWRLLVAIAMHKLRHQISKQGAQRRSVSREVPLQEETMSADSLWSNPPTPGEALALADEIEWIHRQLDAVEQRVFELRLEGYLLDEIAEDVGRSQRTVRRVLEKIRGIVDRQDA
ncbi:MAG: sigma-70 family RNA polymerase sigma factor, partial [Planctomycetales bacterium]|nr:sigma-70 family RNA polymerase sigma factor [Planctomycetales bacterium]